MNKIYILILSILTTAPLLSQKLADISMIWESRYDIIDLGESANRIQASLRIPFEIDVAGIVKVNGLTSTGSSFQSRWETVKDFRIANENRRFNLNLRQLYLEKNIADLRIQFGAIPSIKKSVSSTGLGSNGWIDGFRVDQKTGIGTFEIAAGSINEINNPNYFDREFVSNYFEFEYSSSPVFNTTFEVSYEKFHFNDYLRSEIRHDLINNNGKNLELTLEGLLNTQKQSLSFGITVTTSPLAFIEPDLKKYWEVKAYYNHTDENIGLRGILTDDFYRLGNSLTIEMKGAITKKKGLAWFAEAYISEVPRLIAGLRVDVE